MRPARQPAVLPGSPPTLPMCIKRCVVDFRTANEQSHGMASVIPEGDSDARNAKESCIHGQLRGAYREENLPVFEHLDCREAPMFLFGLVFQNGFLLKPYISVHTHLYIHITCINIYIYITIYIYILYTYTYMHV